MTWAAIAWAGWWCLALSPLSGYWDTNPQYSYGWLVPPLALFLLWRRWQTRPLPEEPARWSTPVIYLSAAVVLPAWIIVQPNPGWRLVPWLLVLSAVAGTVALCDRLGGKSWVRHFRFPIFFMLTAVPWPSAPEEAVVQGLMHFVAGVTVMLMNLAGLPAVQRGNLVEVATGVLGVDEACSGVRSLQAAFMAALFLGEFYRLKTKARVVLVFVGFGAAFLTNIARTAFLSYSAAHSGVSAVGQWHDPAGYTVLTICLVIISIFANAFREKEGTRSSSVAFTPAHSLPVRTGSVLTVWLVLVVASARIWYATNSTGETSTWTLALPPDAREQPLPARSLDLLGCDRTHAADWRDETGAQWTIYFLEWDPSNSRTALLARVHRPEVCLPSAGLVEVGPRRLLTIPVSGFELAFESMHFSDPKGRNVYVFYCPWEIVPGQPGRNAAFSDDTRTASLRRVWHRERLLGQQTAELIITGVASREAAEAALRKELPHLIQSATLPAQSGKKT